MGVRIVPVDAATYAEICPPVLRPLASGPGYAGDGVLAVLIPGIRCLMAFGAGMGAGWIVVAELQTGVIERLRVTPVSRFALLMGSVLRDTVLFVAPALIVIGVAVPFGYHPDAGGTVLMLFLLCLLTATVSAWSAASTTRSRPRACCPPGSCQTGPSPRASSWSAPSPGSPSPGRSVPSAQLPRRNQMVSERRPRRLPEHLIHGYATVADALVWQVLREELPELEEAGRRMLADIDPPQN